MTGASGFARALADLADLADIRGAAATAADLRRAVAAILALPPAEAARLELRARRQRLAEEPGISPAIYWRLQEAAQGDGSHGLRAALAGIPVLARRLIQLQAATPAEALSLARNAGVVTLSDLLAALEAGRLGTAPWTAMSTRLRSAATALEQESRPLPLGRAWDLLEALVERITAACPGIENLTTAGGVRRMEPLVTSPVLVGRAPDPPAALDAIASLPGLDDVVHRGPRRAILLVQQVEVDVRVAAADEYGTALFRATGSPAHVTAIERRRATPILARREADVYAHAGVPYIPPELRHATGEIEAADAGALPRLLTRDDIRGDLHMHSTYSDGRDTLETMIAACSRIGYEYVAITDHSERAGASRTVTLDQLARQRDEIARLRDRFPRLAILHGIEVDVMPDGRLDFPDAVLEPLDIVLASVHDAARQDGRRLTARCLQAIRHPLVTVLTHPGNRVVGHRAAYPLDYPALYAAAADAGTALEIDGAPAHLDLDGEQARAAVGAGVTVVVDSDAHGADRLERQMQWGVGTARRGWVEPRHVLNTRPLADVRRFIETKRRG